MKYEENVKRGKWRVERIESLVTGRDQEVRGERVKVNTIKGDRKDGVLKYTVAKVISYRVR
jgi:hypothetical protein